MNFKKLFLYASVSTFTTFGVTSVVTVQASTTDENDQSAVEEVVVTGIRGSLQQSLDIKRASSSIVDALSAEDIGKFPDNNVAESLGRVPGLAVSRQFGEGDAVSIRGASNALTLTTLNGQNVASTGWYSQQAIDRTFNYAMLPPEMIARIDVYKSSQADLLEGGVGGSVNVKTRKPLELEAGAIFGSVKMTDSSTSDETDPVLSGLYSYKNDDNTFGVLLSLAKSDYSLERRGNEGLPAWGGRIAPTHFEQSRERTAYDMTAQYAPSEALDFSLHYMNLELGANSVNTQIWIPQDLNNCTFNAQGAPILCTATAGSAGDSYWDVRPRNATMESETLDFTVAYAGSGFNVSFQAGTTDASGGTDFETNVGYLSGIGGADGTIDSTGDTVRFQLTDPSFTLPVAGAYAGWEGLQTGAIVSQPNIDEESYFQADATFDVEVGAIKAIKAGVRSSSHEVLQTQNRPTLSGFDGAVEAANVSASQFVSGSLSAGMDGFSVPAPNTAAMIAYTNSFIDQWYLVRSGYSTIEEDNLALYVMAEYESSKVRGNFGLRYISTDASSSFYAPDPSVTGELLSQNNGYATTLSTDTAEYSEILPSFNLAYDATDDVVVRLAVAKVIARPNYSDMFGNSALVGYSDNVIGNEAVVKGNVALEPYKATQTDFGWEWYYADHSMLAFTYFIKDVDNFTTFANVPGQSIGIVDPNSGVDVWLLQSREGGKGGRISGFEVQWQQDYGNGFGTLLNLTSVIANAAINNFPDRNGVFSDSSDLSYNVVGYYENDSFSARAAYTWRSEYFIRETGFYGAREHQDFGTLDLSFAYRLTDAINLSAEVINLLEEDSVQVGRDQTNPATFLRTSNGYPAYNYEGERRIAIGANIRF